MGRVFPMIIWSEFRLGKCGDHGHREDATHFIIFDPVQSLEKVFT